MKYLLKIILIIIAVTANAQSQSRTLGNKSFEVSNHLNNVSEVTSDRKITVASSATLAYNSPDIKAFNDYYPYGMLQDKRNNSKLYRFGFQGQEKDDEVKGNGNSYSTFYRQLDSRIARWTSIDPLVHHNMSTYQSFDNNPIFWSDPRGSNTDSTTVKKSSANHPNVAQRNTYNTGETQRKRMAYVEEISDKKEVLPDGSLIINPSDQITNQALAYARMTPIINFAENVDEAWTSQKSVAYKILTNTYGESSTTISGTVGVGVVSVSFDIVSETVDQAGNLSVDVDVIPLADFFVPQTFKNQRIDYSLDGSGEKTIVYDEISTSSTGVSGHIGIGGSVQEALITFKVKNAIGAIMSKSYSYSRGSIGIGLEVAKIGVSLDLNMDWELKSVTTKIGGKVISKQ